MDNRKLLNVLADGQFRSGSEIGGLLGVSRTAIWKQFQKLEALGLEIESVKGKGYRLPGGFEALDYARISAGLDEFAQKNISKITIVEQIESTNDYLMGLTKSEACSGQVCITEVQTKGRGRRGRTWVSAFGSSVCLSIGWVFEAGVLAIEGLSLAVGVAVVRALDKAGIVGVQLKWPNDILYQGKKLGGVLIELSGDAAGPCEVVVGVGLNVRIPDAEGARIDQQWIDVSSITESACSRNYLTSLLLNELMLVISDYDNTGFTFYQSSWQHLDAFQGEEVMLTLGDKVITGVASGVNDKGALCVNVEGVCRYFNGGEVSLRAVR